MLRARDNPFSTDRVLAVRYMPQESSWEALIERLMRMRLCGAIVGPQGSGKTTLMEDIGLRLRQGGRRIIALRLDEEHPRLDWLREGPRLVQLGAGDVVLLDGASHLGRMAWRLFRWRVRGAGGLLITSHRTGLLPTLIECRTSPQLLGAIAARLDAPAWLLDERMLARLYAEHDGNLREALRAMYDLCADTHAYGCPDR